MHDGKDHHIMVTNRYMDHLAIEHGIHADDLLYSHLPEVATLRYIRNLPNRLIEMGRYFLNEVNKRNSLLRMGIRKGQLKAVQDFLKEEMVTALSRIVVSLVGYFVLPWHFV